MTNNQSKDEELNALATKLEKSNALLAAKHLLENNGYEVWMAGEAEKIARKVASLYE